MFIKNKLVDAFVICAVILSLTMGCFGGAFYDTEGHWAEKTIDKWAEKGVVTGYDGSFGPDSPIIRGEFAVIIDRLMKYTEMSVNSFSDLDKDAYYNEAILKLNKMSIMLGYNGLISPEEYVTREEAFVMLNRVYSIGDGIMEISFEDNDKISDWAYSSVSAMCEAGVINGDEKNRICPKDNITRAEVMQLLENISGLKDENNSAFIPEYVPDVGGLVIVDPNSSSDSEGMGDNESADKNILDAGKIEW